MKNVHAHERKKNITDGIWHRYRLSIIQVAYIFRMILKFAFERFGRMLPAIAYPRCQHHLVPVMTVNTSLVPAQSVIDLDSAQVWDVRDEQAYLGGHWPGAIWLDVKRWVLVPVQS